MTALAALPAEIRKQKDERWKYTDLSFLESEPFQLTEKVASSKQLDDIIASRRLPGESILLVCVNGFFMQELSDLAKLPEQTRVSQAISEPGNYAGYPFAKLNAENSTDGLYLHIPNDYELNLPIHVLSLMIGGENKIAHPRHHIILGKNAQATFVEECYSLSLQRYMVNTVSNIIVNENAKLTHIKIQAEGEQAIHMASTFVTQKKHAETEFISFGIGGLFARDDLIIQLQESGANCKAAGFYHLRRDKQYVDNHVDITHAASHCTSEMLYKGILEKQSKAVFNGRLLVEKDAQKTLAYQANNHLLLSKTAEAYSKPELEIYADDVKCKHGATTGQLDQDALFYLRSRGIEKDEAMQMLLQGFAEDILNRITHPGIKARVQEML